MSTFNEVAVVDELAKLDKEAKALEARIKALKGELVDEYKLRLVTGKDTADAKTFSGSHVVATVTESETVRFDSTKFKKEHEALYRQFTYTSRSTSVRLKNS